MQTSSVTTLCLSCLICKVERMMPTVTGFFSRLNKIIREHQEALDKWLLLLTLIQNIHSKNQFCIVWGQGRHDSLRCPLNPGQQWHRVSSRDAGSPEWAVFTGLEKKNTSRLLALSYLSLLVIHPPSYRFIFPIVPYHLKDLIQLK